MVCLHLKQGDSKTDGDGRKHELYFLFMLAGSAVYDQCGRVHHLQSPGGLNKPGDLAGRRAAVPWQICATVSVCDSGAGRTPQASRILLLEALVCTGTFRGLQILPDPNTRTVLHLMMTGTRLWSEGCGTAVALGAGSQRGKDFTPAALPAESQTDQAAWWIILGVLSSVFLPHLWISRSTGHLGGQAARCNSKECHWQVGFGTGLHSGRARPKG